MGQSACYLTPCHKGGHQLVPPEDVIEIPSTSCPTAYSVRANASYFLQNRNELTVKYFSCVVVVVVIIIIIIIIDTYLCSHCFMGALSGFTVYFYCAIMHLHSKQDCCICIIYTTSYRREP